MVTGAAGFIGWKTSHSLAEKGFDVVGVDNMNDYYDVRLKQHRLGDLKRHENFSFHLLDIENLEAIHDLFGSRRFDAVIHLAARAGVHASMDNPHIYMSTNVLGTLNLLEGMRRRQVRKMVLASTSSLYAGQPMPFREDSPVNAPISPYAASKKASEIIAYTYHHHFDMDIIILRYFTVYGPAGRPDMSIFRFMKWIDEEKPVTLFGDGTQGRDFTYIDDIAAGTVKALDARGYDIINLGGGKKPVTMRDVIKIMEAGLGKKAAIEQVPARKEDIKDTWACIEKAGRVLDWRPETDLEDGLHETIRWYAMNRNWIKNIQM